MHSLVEETQILILVVSTCVLYVYEISMPYGAQPLHESCSTCCVRSRGQHPLITVGQFISICFQCGIVQWKSLACEIKVLMVLALLD